MRILTVATSVRFRAAQGEASFYNPFTAQPADNSTHASVTADGKAKGSWVTLDAGTEYSVVAAYGKGSTYCLVVNEEGTGLTDPDETYGLVVREDSMAKLLDASCVVLEEDVEVVAEESTSEVADVQILSEVA